MAILANVSNPFSVLELGEAQAAARALGLEVNALEIRRSEDIGPAIDALKGRAEALYVFPDGLVNANRIRINISALGARLPTMHAYRDYVDGGPVLSGSSAQAPSPRKEETIMRGPYFLNSQIQFH